MPRLEKLLQYGVPNDLAAKAVNAGLSVTSLRAINQGTLVTLFGLAEEEAKALTRAVKRQPIDENVATILLESSNYTCNICKGTKSKSFVIHHIIEYEKTQDNSYGNLVVLCPADHDLAHQSGLSLGISQKALRGAKNKWEKQVEVANAQRAAQAFKIQEDALDYINVLRIEAMCLRHFGNIPITSYTAQLKGIGILNQQGRFDRRYVQENLSGGSYLFDFIASGETLYYAELFQKLLRAINFADIDQEALKGFRALKAIEGDYGYFIGGVSTKRPQLPITQATPPVTMRYKRKGFRIQWQLDPNFVMAMSAFGRLGRTTRYVVYSMIRSVEHAGDGTAVVDATPLLIAPPTVYVHKIPTIKYERDAEAREAESDDDDAILV